MKLETIPERYSVGWMLQLTRASPAETVIMICYEHINVKGQSEMKRKEGWDLRVLIGKNCMGRTHNDHKDWKPSSLVGVLWSLSLENSVTGSQPEMWRSWAPSQLFFPLL